MILAWPDVGQVFVEVTDGCATEDGGGGGDRSYTFRVDDHVDVE